MLKIESYFSKGNERSIAVKKNIAISLVLKGINILTSLLIVPLTVGYVNPTRYGIWLTLSSIIGWLAYFDLGFGNGFRNRFTEAKAKGDTKLAKEYVSTTYAVLTLLFSVILIVVLLINNILSWSEILNIDNSYDEELKLVFSILACFFCINIVASIFTTMITADQKPALADLIKTIGQVFTLACIFILTKTTAGNLSLLALAYSGIPCVLLILVSLIMFRREPYRDVSPSFRYVRFFLSKQIIGLGGQFFVIMIAMLVIYQFINIILTRIEGPDSVTQYNIAQKYYSIVFMVANIILTPFWSAFTDAYVKKDLMWMKNVLVKLEKLWIITIPVLILMVLFSDVFFKLWIGDSVVVPKTLSIFVALYVLFQTGSNVYMLLINGTSKVRMQLIVYVCGAIVAIPLMSICCKSYGVEGILFVPTLVYVAQMIIGKIQISKIINNKDMGIWSK